MTTKFQIKESIEINLECVTEQGGFTFSPAGLDSANDWASYSLETADGDLIAEHVSFEALEIRNEDLLTEWYKQTCPKDYEFFSKEGDVIVDVAKEKLEEVFDSPDALYNAHLASAKRTAMSNWIAQESPKVYRNDIRGFGNEFNLTFVLPGAGYDPDDDEYEVAASASAEMAFMYTDDPTTEDYASITVVE